MYHTSYLTPILASQLAPRFAILVLVYPANPTTLSRPSRPPPNRVIPPHCIRVDYLGVPRAIEQPGSFASKVLEIFFVITTFGRASYVQSAIGFWGRDEMR